MIGRCYLRHHSGVDLPLLADVVADFNARVCEPQPPGFVQERYAPRDDDRITPEDRVFYTRANAQGIDNYRRLIETAPREIHELLLGPLLSEASIHANTGGVFKGFYKA